MEPFEEANFWQKYRYDHLKMVTVINPLTEDYDFQCVVEAGVDMATGKMNSEARQYRVKAGGTERFPGPIANIYLDQICRIVAQNEDKFRHLMDWALRAKYYDRLVVDVEDLVSTYQPFSNYLQESETEDSPQTDEVEEKPFATVAAPKNKGGRPRKVT
jgi:hypothetical protein